MKIRELPILVHIDPKTKKRHAAATKCCGWEKPAICFPHVSLWDNNGKVKYFLILIIKMVPRLSKIMTAIEDKSRPAAFVPYTNSNDLLVN